ncbi:MAG: penicillin acylase family protein, partial [Flavisolibacter sp.]
YDDLRENDSLKQLLKEPISIIRVWDKNSTDTSVATTLAIEWAYKLDQLVPSGKTPEARSNSLKKLNSMASDVDPMKKLQLLVDVINDLQKRSGNWRIAWGIINRYQRINAGERFDDEKPSLPVGLAAATWGSLPSFATIRPSGLIKRYGVSGNSFIACVEFGKKVKAKAISTGGSSFDPSSKHFTDQANGYINGNFKDIFFYKEDVLKHVEKKYHPGSEAGL